MELKEKKAWLWRYRDTLREVESLERLEAERRLEATGMAAKSMDGLPGAPVKGNRAGIAEVRHLEVLADLEEAQRRSDAARREILAAAAGLPGAEADVVRCRYINGHTWNEIRDITGYSRSWVLKLHKSALENIECGTK